MFVDRPVGIDLGTTNSEIALLDPSERDLVIYADRFGRKTVPSAIAWDPKAGAIVVGHAARSRRGKTPPPIESIKRRMGTNATVTCGPISLTPEEVSAKILAELRARMEEQLAGQAPKGIEVKVARAVITVPAYFDAPQIEATRKAGTLAGLDVLGILQEPTAAAIYHTWKNRLGDGNFLVYDLGGGTFDVSVLRCVGGEYQVLAIDGDNLLGGDDLDRRYAETLRVALVAKGYALDLDVRGDEEDRHRFGRIVHLAQEIKESLSTSEVVHVSRENVAVDKQGEPVTFEAEVGRAEYEAAVKDLVDTTIACAERALARSLETANVGIADIDHVVLVGGSTRVPLVIRRVTEALASKSKSAVILQDEVDTCVALGAAVHAAQLGGLRIGDSEKRMSVLLTTPLVADSPQIRVGVRVDEAPDGAVEIAVLRGEEILARAPIPSAEEAPARLLVKLGEEREDSVRVGVLSHTGAVIGAIPFTLYRGDVRARASALSRPSVVAKDIALEIVRAGRRERRVLIARGSGLPTEITHRFFTADQSGAIVLRLLQNRLPIKTLLLEVPKDLAVGTAVELTLRCDEAMRLEARADVAGQKLWAQIEPAEVARFDHTSNVDALLEEAEAAGRALWGGHAAAYRSESEKLITGIREVVAIDPDKLAVLCQRLRSLVDEFRGGPSEELAPPMHHFESELDDLRRVVYRAPGSLLGMDRETWDARMGEIETRAHEAYRSVDPIGWRRAFNEVQALYETAVQEEFASMRLDDPAYLARRLQSVVRYANRVERSLADFVPSATEEVRARQMAECAVLVAALNEKVTAPLAKLTVDDQTDASALRRKLEQMSAELVRIEGAVERIPALGLVTERAQ